jgi:hypothetical protein
MQLFVVVVFVAAVVVASVVVAISFSNTVFFARVSFR